MTALIVLGLIAIALVLLLVVLTELVRTPTELEQLAASPTALEVEILLGCSLFGVTRLYAGTYRQHRYLPRDLFLRAVREGHNPRDVQTTLVDYARKCGNWKGRRWVTRQIQEVWELTAIPKNFPSEEEVAREPSGEPKERSNPPEVLPAPPAIEKEATSANSAQDTSATKTTDGAADNAETAEAKSTSKAKAPEGPEESTASAPSSNQATQDEKEQLQVDAIAEFEPDEESKPKAKQPAKRSTRKKPTKRKKAQQATAKSSDSGA